MHISEGVKISVSGITSRKLRTFLTMLGVIFGVAAVISMLSIQEGAKRKVLDQIQAMGTRNILVMKQKPPKEEDKRLSEGLTLADANSIEKICPDLRFVSAVDTIQLSPIWSVEGKSDARVLGVTQDYGKVLNYRVQEGRFFSKKDLEDYRRVCVLGYQAKRDLFGVGKAVGKDVKMGNYWFSVIGVMEQRYIRGGMVGDVEIQDLNENIFIPITTVYKHLRSPFSPRIVSQIILQVKDEELIWEIGTLTEKILQRRHRKVKDYQIVIPEALLQQSMEATKTFNIVMGAIAGISLLVGGIGIMNIMLASVLERTREIGVRRAIGATRGDILLQFLIESVMISLSGGILGIMFGFALGQAISRYAHLPTVTSWIAVVVSFVVASSVGIIFGIYPARRAALLNPIEALRYE